MAVCVFCSRSGGAMTREHVFARWLVSRVRGARLVPSAPPEGAAATMPLRIARVIAQVCADCNAGWMSGLEVRLRQMLFAQARAGHIPAPDRVALARWFTKTATLLAHGQGAVLIGPAQRAQLATGMPDQVEVFLGRRRRPRQPLDFALDTVADGEGLAVNSVAIQVDDLVGHVAAGGTLGGAAGTRLCPLRSHALRWETLPVLRPAAARVARRSSG